MTDGEIFIWMRNLIGKRVKIGAYNGIVEAVGLIQSEVSWKKDYQIQFADGECVRVSAPSEVEICGEERNTVTQERIDHLMDTAEFAAHTIFDKCTIVSAELENGFVIVEYSACVDPANYDKDLGVMACKEKIEERLWELEAYALQKALYEQGKLKF